MPTIFLVLAQFSHYSDVLRGRLIREIAKSCRVVVLTPWIDAPRAEADNYFTHKNVSYHKLELAHPRLWLVCDKFIRVPLVRSFDHLAYMRHFYERSHQPLRKFLMHLGVFLPKNALTTDRLTRWETVLARPSSQFLTLVKTHRPALLVTATPGFTFFEAEMIVFAKHLGILTAAIDINYDNLTSNGKLIRKVDYLATWNHRMQQEARQLHGYPIERAPVIGCLRFDHYTYDRLDPFFPTREEFLASKNLDPAKRTIVHAGPTPSNYPPRKELVRMLVDFKETGLLAGDPNIFIRVHPIDALDNYREFMNIPGVHIERAGRPTRPDSASGQKIEMSHTDALNLTATLAHADVIVNFASTVIIEACLFDKPVINVGFPDYRRIVYDYEYNKGLLDTGAVRLASTPEELVHLTNQYLIHPERDREQRKKLARDYVPFRDGQTYIRTADFIWRVISGDQR